MPLIEISYQDDMEFDFEYPLPEKRFSCNAVEVTEDELAELEELKPKYERFQSLLKQINGSRGDGFDAEPPTVESVKAAELREEK